jgi:hypothetical protein
VANVYTIQKRAGCDGTYGTPNTGIKINPEAAIGRPVAHRRRAEQPRPGRRHRLRRVHGRRPARAAGYAGTVEETVAINPALAISGVEILQQWMGRPDYMAIMSDCGNVDIGVWSENLVPDRSVVVAVYGKGDSAAPVPLPASVRPASAEPAQLWRPAPPRPRER